MKALLLLSGLLASACQRDATAQGVQEDYAAPIGCFSLVSASGAASLTGIEVCSAATSVAPGQCFLEGTNSANLTTTQLTQLCRGATSLDPLTCFERLSNEGSLTSTQALDYCAPSCPIGPAPAQSSSASCVVRAMDNTDLALQMIGELCLNSRSTAPVDCYVHGASTTQLASSQLVQLCENRNYCQYVNQAPY